jgi:hypothetical protein
MNQEDNQAPQPTPNLTEIDQECFSIVDGLVLEPSCSNNSCDILLSYNHEYALEYILDSHILQGKNNHVDHFTLGGEINTQHTSFSTPIHFLIERGKPC